MKDKKPIQKNTLGNSDREKSNHRKYIYLAIIVLLLLLLTSCTSKFWGTIGSLFRNEGSYEINPGTDEDENILNQSLFFDVKEIEFSLSDVSPKISYHYKNIVPGEFTCSTNDASIATCYVEDGYVVLNPKAVGKVTIYLRTHANGKTYEASVDVTITDAERFIRLSSMSGTINLAYSNKKYITYQLEGLTGEVKVSSSDESIATAVLEGGRIKILGHKVGTATITVSVTYQGVEYASTFTVTVTKSSSGNNSQKPGPGGQDKPSSSDNPHPSNSPTQTPTPTKTPGDGTGDVGEPGENDGSCYLTQILFSNGYQIENFDKTKTDYFLEVSHHTDVLEVIASREHPETTTITYKISGKEVDPENLTLNDGVNELEITITSHDGKSSLTYHVTIYKPVRKIEMEKSFHLSVEDLPTDLLYTIYESKYNPETKTEFWEEFTNYSIDDITFQLTDINGNDCSNLLEKREGTIYVKDGGIDLLNQSFDLTVTYREAKEKAHSKLYFLNKAYKLSTVYQDGPYIIDFTNQTGYKNIILPTNFFTGDLVTEPLKNASGEICGIRIRESLNGITNQDVYIDIQVENPNILEVLLENHSVTSAIAIKANAKALGNSKVTVTGVAYGVVINNFDIDFSVVATYTLILDANGGFYNELTTEYQFRVHHQLSSEEFIYLGDEKYKAYRVDKDASNSCVYYKLVGYNTEKDGSGVNYPLTTIFKNFDSDLTLYAQWEVGTEEDKPEIEKRYYLPNFNLFYNKEYFEKYDKEKIVYPGASGSYVTTFTNNTPNNIVITGMTLREDKTICVREGCLNMGYAVRFTPKDNRNYVYYYGGANEQYKILNRDTSNLEDGIHKIKFGDGISVAPGEGVEFSLLWRWVDEKKYDIDHTVGINYNLIDTLIGSKVSNINNEYQLSVSVEFINEENYCSFE